MLGVFHNILSKIKLKTAPRCLQPQAQRHYKKIKILPTEPQTMIKCSDQTENYKMSATEVGSLEQAAVKRKERLAALRASKSKKQSGQDKEEKLPT